MHLDLTPNSVMAAASLTKPALAGHDPGWRHYVVLFERPRTCMLIMTNSSNGEDIYDALLRNEVADAFTPVEWQGFKPLRDMARYER